MTENRSNNQPLIEERLSRIENAIAELTTGQQQTLSLLGSVIARLESIEADLGSVKTDVAILKLEVAEVKDDAKPRYVDLRERIMLNNDHLGVLDRTLRQLVKDLRQPLFPSADTR
jgi:hypothetical protein